MKKMIRISTWEAEKDKFEKSVQISDEEENWTYNSLSFRMGTNDLEYTQKFVNELKELLEDYTDETIEIKES